MRDVCLIHIAPELPPTVGGVADYTDILSRELLVQAGRSLELVLIHAGKSTVATIDGELPVVDRSGRQSAATLADTVRQLAHGTEREPVILLEYSGYGYANRGAPLWLLRGLSCVCGENGIPLVTMFHELYATGMPWTGAFWISPLQRLVAAKLARSSAAIVTNRHSAVSWLQRYRSSSATPIRVQPVFSNVGEPEEIVPYEQRRSHIAVFGGGGRKAKVYDKHRDSLRWIVNRKEFAQVVDIGPSDDSFLPNETWSRPLGVMSAEEISDWLASASLGVLSYPGRRLGKSGVAAAFASHGVPFVLFDEDDTSGNTDPYIEGEHFLRGEALAGANTSFSDPQLERMSRAIHRLYQDRLHSTQAARCFLDLIDSIPQNSSIE